MSFLFLLASLAFAGDFTGINNTLGQRGKPVVQTVFDPETGCLIAVFNSGQHVDLDAAGRFVGADAAAIATCTKAESDAKVAEIAAKADAEVTTTLAHAGGIAVVVAASDGKSVYVDAQSGIAATDGAAFLAAGLQGGTVPFGASNTLAYQQTAWEMTRPIVTESVTTRTRSSGAGKKVATVSKTTTTDAEAEARHTAAVAAAQRALAEAKASAKE